MSKFSIKKRVCAECGSPATYFYKQWWCGHTRELKGVCSKTNEKGK